MTFDDKKRICIILPGKLPIPNIKGGAIESLMTLLLDQNEIYQKVYFVVVSAWAEGVEEAASKYKYAEFHYIKIRNGFWKRAINCINYIIAVRTGNIDYFKTPFHYDIQKVMKKVDVNAVVVEHGVYKHFEFLRKEYNRAQLYLHLHGTGPMPDKNTRTTFGHVITVSEFVKNLYYDGFKSYNTQFHVCLNGIDDRNFNKRISAIERNKIRKGFGVSDKELLVIYCGRLVHEKGVKELIRAIIDTHNPCIKLMIIGSSNFEDEKTTDYVKELQSIVKGYEKQIFFTGYLPNNTLYQYYQSADIQVVCSIYEEAGGLVNIEGMMSGLPLIVTDSGGIPEYTDGKCCNIINKFNSLYDNRDGLKVSEQLRFLFEYYYENKERLLEISKHSNDKVEAFTAKRFYERFITLIC